jgi:hypothetical protein
MCSVIQEDLNPLFFWCSSLKKITIKRKERCVICAKSLLKLALEHIMVQI